MSTNDTLRGRFLAWLPKYWNRETFIDDEGDELFIEDWVQGAWVGYSAALAEPVSGGVVDDGREEFERLITADGWPHAPRVDRDASGEYRIPHVKNKWEGWKLRAALNGGAVAGQCATCQGSGVVSTTSTDHNGDHIEQRCPTCDYCHHYGRDACTCKGGE